VVASLPSLEPRVLTASISGVGSGFGGHIQNHFRVARNLLTPALNITTGADIG
jgi:hypothetical protein